MLKNVALHSLEKEVIVSALASGSLQWFAVRVKSNRENVVFASLSAKGYEVFLPNYRFGNSQERPLFPGYLFCRFDVKERLPILVLPGVMHIVGNGKTPIPLDEEEVESLRILVKAKLALDPIDFFSVGQKLRIDHGPLAGAVGIVTGRKNQRLIASITLLQRSVAVELLPEWVIPEMHRRSGENPALGATA